MKFFAIILTGLSGSGKTVALRALEDCGFFCTDNLPTALLDDFIKISSGSGISKIAIGIDIREKEFLSGIEEKIRELKSAYNTELIFLEAEKDSLIRRFKETRRPHPLGGTAKSDIEKAIDHEISVLLPLKEFADRIIDTTSYSPHQLREAITSAFRHLKKDSMSLILTSFGYKFGVPSQADIVFDVRFLENPHFVPDLRDLTGLDLPVKEYIFRDRNTAAFLRKLMDILDFLVPLYIKEGKSYLNICIGCTGGKHRSVAIVQELAGHLKKLPVHLEIVHREL